MKRRTSAVWITLLCGMFLTACAVKNPADRGTDGSGAMDADVFVRDEIPDSGGNIAPTEDVSTEESLALQVLMEKEEKERKDRMLYYLPVELQAEGYLSLAKQCGEEGFFLRQRDLLEQAYRLYGGEETLEMLGGIYVNIEEESGKTYEMLKLIVQDMAVDEYRAECLHVMEDEEWFGSVMPKLSEGVRNYFRTVDGELRFVVTAGYTDEGVKYTDLYYFGEEEQILTMDYRSGTAMVMEAGFSDGRYEGNFVLWTLDGNQGTVIKESGTFEGGKLSGDDYAVNFHKGNSRADVFDLWNNRGTMKYVEAVTKGEQTVGSRIAYVPAAPAAVTIYESENVGKDELEGKEKDWAGEVKIRVYDGEIQICTEQGWLSLGLLEDLAKQDIFGAYAQAKQTADGEEPKAAVIAEPQQVKPEPEPEPAAEPVDLQTQT